MCDAAIRYLLLGQPPELPPGFLGPYSTAHQPPFSDIRDLTNKGRLYLDDDAKVLLIRKITKVSSRASSRPSGRAEPLLNDEPIRMYVPTLMRP